MQTAILTPEPPITAVPDEPFAYGWRDVEWIAPNGEQMHKRIPLTLEDILHPEAGDFRMHSEKHERNCTYLYNIASAAVKSDPNAVALYDVRIAWDAPNIKPHVPDVSVIFNVRDKQNWSTFDCAKEGTQPVVIFEVTSPKTRSVDIVSKVDEYEEVGLDYYIIIDTQRLGGREVLRLLGYEMTANGFTVMVPNNKERLWIEPLGIFIGIEENEVVCYDGEGETIANYVGMMEERDFAWEQAETERKRAEAAESRAAQLAAELARLRAELGRDDEA